RASTPSCLPELLPRHLPQQSEVPCIPLKCACRQAAHEVTMERSAAIGPGPFSFRGWIGLLRMDLKGEDWPTRPEAGAHSHTMRGEERKKGGRRGEEEKRGNKREKREKESKKKEGILYGLILHDLKFFNVDVHH